MKNFEQITKDLSVFVNITLSKAGWVTVLKGCKLPKNDIFWKFFRLKCLSQTAKLYTLVRIDNIEEVYNAYCIQNQEAVAKTYKKKKAKEKAKSVILPHLVIDPRSGRIISHMYAIENKYEN